MSESPDLKSLFWQAREIESPEERAAFIQEACRGNEALRVELESLVNAATPGDFLDKPLFASAIPNEDTDATFGPYKVIEKLGEGGMGAVFRAEQANPRRHVALKVIRPGMDSTLVIARFEAERQALAIMDHPHIAKVFDAGVTPKGRPFFAMELVQGVPITQYCDDVRMPPKERLELFILVCQAIQHAHQKGLIHRDIKPSNVLVSIVDGTPIPKVIDFGIAKAINRQGTEQSLFTQFGVIAGTPAYMSPEQADPLSRDVDTRSDVYALGVLLYELLTGTTPIPMETVRAAAFEEIYRMIRTVEPPTPSTRLSDSGESLASIAAVHQTEPARLTRTLRGDLDWIIMKALEKDRNRRYNTAVGFAKDIHRYLDGDPVEAGPPSAAYKLKKFARKHRTALATAAAFVLLLTVMTGISIRLAFWAMKEATRAEGREKIAIAAVKRFGDAVIQSPELKNNESLAPLRKTLLKEPLAFFTSLRDQLQDNQNTRPESLADLGTAVFELATLTEEIGDHEAALNAFQESANIRERLRERNPSSTEFRHQLAVSLTNVGKLQHVTGENQLAIVSNGHALAILEILAKEFPGNTSYQVALGEAHNNLAAYQVALGRRDLGLESYKHGLSIRDRLARENPAHQEYRDHVAGSHINIGKTQLEMGENDLALESFGLALALNERRGRENPSDTFYQDGVARILNSIGVVQTVSRRFDLALRPLERSIAILVHLTNEYPSVTAYQAHLAMSYQSLGNLQVDLEKADLAIQSYQLSLDGWEKLARANPSNAGYQSGVGALLFNIGKLQQSGKNQDDLAEKSYSRAAEIFDRLSREHPSTPEYLESLARIYFGMGELYEKTRKDLALTSFKRSIEIREQLVREHPTVADYQKNLKLVRIHLFMFHLKRQVGLP